MEEKTYLKRMVSFALAIILIIFSISIIWNIWNGYKVSEGLAKNEALASFNKDLIYRRWISMHGGVYAPITTQTPPNQYLHAPEREISTPSGKKLTLINPAYMTRQVQELGNEQYRSKGHITSLKPLRPENKPNKWETEALKLFEKGEKEYTAINQINNESYLCFMRPMITEKSCLKCHASQGYKINEIRGGISISVPLKEYYEIATNNSISTIIIHILLLIIVLVIGFFVIKKYSKEIDKRLLIQKRLKKSETGLKIKSDKYEELYLELQDKNTELTIAKNKAEESDRLKSSFLHNISHEVRTPMNAIMGFTNLLTKSNLSEEKAKKFTQIITDSTHQLLTIIDDIIDISSIESGTIKLNYSEINLHEKLDSIYEYTKLQTNKKKIELYFCIDKAIKNQKIFTDDVKLTVILNNLLNNAIKFTHKGEIKLTVQIKDGFLNFAVKDSGIGILTENLETIFERFRQANDDIHVKYGGNGLGLSISKAYIELLGGRIWVKTTPDVGSVFYFTIPYREVSQTDIEYHALSENSYTILIVEDDEYNYMYIKELLSKYPLEILRAENGNEAFKIFKEYDISLVIMDIKMPELDGYEATKKIREIDKQVPILAHTAYATNDDRTNIMQSGFDDYIAKPIDVDIFIKKVINLIENYKNKIGF